MDKVKLAAGFITYQLANWSRYQSVLDDMARALALDNAPVESLNHPVFQQADVAVDVLRMDRIHPVVSGNKWFKLRYNLAYAVTQKTKGVITFGGAWSNHLHALAFACDQLGLEARAIVRGEEWQTQSTPLLDDVRRWGMDIIPVSRQEYRLRNESAYQRQLAARFPGHIVIPEGGDNALGLMGVANLRALLSPEAQRRVTTAHNAWVACGTGNTLLGTRLALPTQIKVSGVAALKGHWYQAMMARRMAELWPYTVSNWQVFTQFHGGGFAKLPTACRDFMIEFERITGMPLDPVYTAKLCYALVNLTELGAFSPGQRLLMIHTGGLQGRRSLDTD